MTKKAPEAFDRLLHDLPVGHAPVEDLLRAGRTAKRRRRTVISGAVAAAVLAVGLGTAAGQALVSGGGTKAPIAGTPTEPQNYSITVETTPDPDAVYFEGALHQVTLTEAGSEQPVDPYDPASPPLTRSWEDLPAGGYVIEAALRVCGGNCGALAPPSDACQQTLSLNRNIAISIHFEDNRPCVITIKADQRPEGDANAAPVDLPTNTWQPGDPSQRAGGSGRLALDENGCVHLAQPVGPRGGVRMYATWPEGYTATTGPRGLRLYDANGTEVAREGDQVVVGGGSHSAPAPSHPCVPGEQTEVFAIQSQVTKAKAGSPTRNEGDSTSSALLPASEQLAVGETAPLAVYVGCGLRYATIDGSLWETSAQYNGSTGFGFIKGPATRTATNQVEFATDSITETVTFRPAVIDPNHICY